MHYITSSFLFDLLGESQFEMQGQTYINEQYQFGES